MSTRRLIATVLLVTILSISAWAAGEGEGDAGAADFPTKPITVINPFSAGGSADNTARVLAQYARDHLGQNIVVENRTGGGGTIGQNAGAQAAADGYTLTLLTPSFVTNTIFANVAYTVDSFEPVIGIVNDPDFLAVRNVAPFNEVESLLEFAKANPGQVRIGNSGPNSSDSFTAQAFEEASEIEVTHIPFDGGALSSAAVLGGHIEAVIGNYSEFEAKEQTGEMRIILAFSEERMDYAPNVPTARELGIDVISGSWRGFAAPAGTDPARIAILHEAFKAAMEDPDYIQQMKDLGIPVMYRNPEAFKAVIQSDYRRFTSGQ